MDQSRKDGIDEKPEPELENGKLPKLACFFEHHDEYCLHLSTAPCNA